IRGFMNAQEYKIVSQHTQKFIVNRLKRTTAIDLVSDTTVIDNYALKGIIVGSDQCWRPRTARKIEKLFLANYVNHKIRRVSYAASFGTSDWEYTEEQENKAKQLIK